MPINNMNTITTQKTVTLAYYSGNYALDCPATTGEWSGDTFTAADGTKWTVDHADDSPHPSIDGTDTHYLLPLSH